MNKLLIHHNNSFLIENKFFSKEEQFYFAIDSDISDIDFYISEQLLKGALKEKIEKTDLIFIKVALSKNYLEYAGLRLAYHIRLSKQLGSNCFLPIVFVGEETYQFLGLTSDLPQLLFTNGIYLMKDNPSDLNRYLTLYQDGRIKPLDDFDSFLKKQKINAPSNYQSHHSIANEWSLLRWSELLSISLKDNLLAIKQNVESLLYYKYLLAKNPIESEVFPKLDFVKDVKKVLYVDDEWDKGWNLVLNSLFEKISSGQSFQTLEISFKDAKSDDVVTACMDKIKEYDPDIIILDLRLCDVDFKKETKTDELTGYKILKLLKAYNAGIQVIIFSASNKIWNLIELQNADADGYVLKDSPEVNNEKANVSASIVKFIEAIDVAAKKHFIKDLVKVCNIIIANLNKQNVPDNYEYTVFISTLKIKIKVCMSALKMINLEKPSTIDIAFLSFYNFLEGFGQHYLKYAKDYRIYMGEDREILNRYFFKGRTLHSEEFVPNNPNDKPSWGKALAGLFVDYFKISSQPYDEIRDLELIQNMRNDYIHSSKQKFNVEELICIVSLCEKSCSKLKD